MKKNIKNSILETGFHLFSERGYANVSMRDIADALGMSVGNLTYHFRTKEELIEATLIAQNAAFQKPPTPTTLKELNDLFLRGLEHQKSDDYFFRHYDQLKIISPKVYALQVEAIQRRKEALRESFRILERDGYMKEEEVAGHREALLDVINMIKVYWSPSNQAFGSAQDSPLACLWSIIHPLLTEKGKAAFRDDM